MAELFDRFEVNRMPRWPLMTRLVALSVVLHGLFLVAVIYVPTLRSLVRVAGSVAGIEFVSEDYDRTLVGQRATIVKLEPYEKLYYPTDYFGPPPGMDFPQPTDPVFIQPAAPPPPPVVYKPRRVRTPKPQGMPTPEPTPQEIVAASPTPTPDPKAEEEARLNELAKASNIDRPPKINTKPFEDIAKKGKEMFDQGKLNLNGAVGVTATAERNADGTLNRDTVRLDWDPETTTDETMALLAQEFITALSESRVLSVLAGAKTVQMSLKLDGQKILVRIATEVESDARASEMATGYGLMLVMARKSKEGTEEGDLYNNLNVAADGKQFVMNFEMPRDAAGKMIADLLAKKAAKEAREAAEKGTTGKS